MSGRVEPKSAERSSKGAKPDSKPQSLAKTQKLRNGVPVEDKLIQYKENIVKKLSQQRAMRQAEELSLLQRIPTISPVSRRMVASRSAGKSLLERFRCCEDARVRRKMQGIREKTEREVCSARGYPQVPPLTHQQE